MAGALSPLKSIRSREKARLYSNSSPAGMSPCTMPLSLWLAWKVTTLRALIGISSPVRGLRPGRGALRADVEVAEARQLDVVAGHEGAVDDRRRRPRPCPWPRACSARAARTAARPARPWSAWASRCVGRIDLVARLVVVVMVCASAAQARTQALTQRLPAPSATAAVDALVGQRRCRRPAVPGARPGCARRRRCRPWLPPACRCRTGAPSAPGRCGLRRCACISASCVTASPRPPARCRATTDCWRGTGANAGRSRSSSAVEVELEQHRRLRQLVGLAPLRVQFADTADRAGRPARRARSAPGAAPGASPATKRARARREQRLDVALDVEEVDRALLRAPLQRVGAGRRPGRPGASAGARRPRATSPSAAAASRRNTRPTSNTRTRAALRARL